MKTFSLQKSFAWRSFFQTMFFFILLFLGLAYFIWKTRILTIPMGLAEYGMLLTYLLLYGLLIWMFQKNTLTKLLLRQGELPAAKRKKSSKPKKPKSEADGQTLTPAQQKRLFFHLFSILQREGRLLDFFQEDLSLYEDEQIGAAVRSIQENCKKTMDRYLKPEPVMEQAEGDSVDIPAGFDQNAIKLVGNVVGEPPFTGVVRHRGWKLKSAALPKFSDSGNPDIIAPAEIEIG